MKPMPGAIVSQFGRLARSANNVPPLHLLAGIAAILVALTLATPFAFEAGGDNAFIALTIPAGLLTIVATHLAERVPLDRALWLVFGLGILLRAYVLLFDPFLSSDIYRYVWDGRVQAAGINPYRYLPAHEALAFLRDGTIFPHINRADTAVTIYPPAAQFFFLIVTRIDESVTMMRLALMGCEAATVTLIMLLLRRMNRPVTRVIAYLWHPLPLWEIANSGHVDALMVALMLLGLWIALTGHALRGAVLITFAALVKPFAAPALAGIWRPWDLKMPLVLLSSLFIGRLGGFWIPDQRLSDGRGDQCRLRSLAVVAVAACVWRASGRCCRLRGAGCSGPLVQGALGSPQRSSHHRVQSCRHKHAVTHGSLVVVAQLSLVFSGHHAVCSLVWLPTELGRFDRSALAVGTTRLGFLHSENGDQINSIRRSFAGLGLCGLEDPDAAHRRRTVIAMSLSGEIPAARAPLDPRRYHESVTGERSEVAQRSPVCLYLEVTNRCNLLCTTCPRTYEELEPPADMSWDLFTSIVDQAPGLARAVLHGVGESMLVANLPKMVRYLTDRSVYVLFNTNGTLLSENHGRALIDAGLDELRVSLDASNRESFKAIRGRDYFGRIIRNVRAFRELQEREGHTKPQVSVWLTGLKETVEELPAFVKIAAEIGVKEVYLQRLVFFDESAIGKARPDQALFERLTQEEAAYLKQAEDLARSLGVTFSASGAATEPGRGR